MSSFKTLRRGDPHFLSYLLGSFSQNERAIPVESLNLDSENESVTFKIVPVKSIEKVNFLQFWYEILKLKSVPLVLMPVVLVAFKNSFVDELSYSFAVLGTLFLYFGLNLRNDFVDYIKGTDRWHLDGHIRPLQRGWITAKFCRNLSWVFLGASLLASVPIYLRHPQTLVVVGLLLSLALASRAFFQNSYKFKLFYEFYLFLFIGPGLFSGLQLAAGQEVDLKLLYLSVVWGWLGTFFVYLRYFQNIVTNDHFQVVNTINWFGFERAKYFLAFIWMSFLALYFAYYSYFSSFMPTLIAAVAMLGMSLPSLSQLIQLQSPLGSEHIRNNRSWSVVFILVILFWLLQEFWIYQGFMQA